MDGPKGSFMVTTVSLIEHCKPIPVMKTGFSLCTFPNREKPVFITGIPANVNRFFPVWEKYTGKTLFWPCTGPVRDCSALHVKVHFYLSHMCSNQVSILSGPTRSYGNFISLTFRSYVRTY